MCSALQAKRSQAAASNGVVTITCHKLAKNAALQAFEPAALAPVPCKVWSLPAHWVLTTDLESREQEAVLLPRAYSQPCPPAVKNATSDITQA